MATLSAEDFSTSATESFTVSQTPLTDDQIAQKANRQPVITAPSPDLNKQLDAQFSPEATFQRENARPGIPLQTTEPGRMGHPLMRFEVSRARTMGDKMAYLEGQVGKGNVRLSQDGNDFILTVPDAETGGIKDIPLNERKMTIGDLAPLASIAPDLAAGALAMIAGRKSPAGALKGASGIARDIVTSTLGIRGAGAVEDVAMRASEGRTIDLPEIATERGKEAIGDIGAGAATAGLAKLGTSLFRMAQSPLYFSRTAVQTKNLDALKAIQEKTGITIDLSVGESTGLPFAIQSEKFLEQHPASAARQLQAKAIRDAQVNALRQYMISGAGTDDEAGKGLTAALQAIRDVTEGDVTTAAKQVADQSKSAITKLFADATGTATSMADDLQAGKSIRDAVLAKRQEVLDRKNELWGKVYELPEAKEDIIPTKPLKDTLSDIRKNLPDRTSSTEKITYDQYGNPSVSTSQSKEVMGEYVPPEIRQFIAGKFDPKMPLNKMIEMRSLIYDKISEGQAVQDIPTRYLKQAGHAITEAIDQGVNSLPSGELKTRLLAAQKQYKDEVLKLHEKGVASMVPTSIEPGFVGDSAISRKFLNDPDRFNEILTHLGPSSPEAAKLRRNVADTLMTNASTDTSLETVSGEKLFEGMMDLKKRSPSMFTSVFGNKAENIIQMAKALGASEGEIPIQDAVKFFEPGNKSATLKALNDLMAAQRDKNVQLRNSILKDFSNGTLETKNIQPDSFVRAFTGPDTSPEQMKQIMERIRDLDPEISNQLERKLVEKALLTAGTSGKKLEEILADDRIGKKLKDNLPSSTYELLGAFKDYLKNRDYYDDIARDTGVLSKGTAVGKLLRQFPFISGIGKITDEVGDLVKMKVLSAMIASSPARWYLGRQVTSGDMPGIAKAVAVSGPFLKAFAEDINDPSVLANVAKNFGQVFGVGAGQSTNTAPRKIDEF